MKLIFLLILFLFIPLGGQSLFTEKDTSNESLETIAQRFPPPEGFQRINIPSNSFGAWLRKMPLQKAGNPVLDYRGHIHLESKDTTLAAVTAMDIAGRKLHQCMDVILRLYAEFQIEKSNIRAIGFPLPDGLRLPLWSWINGYRPTFRGLHFRLKRSAGADSSLKSIQEYLRTIFYYSNTQTFYHHYKPIDRTDLQIGDFIVKKGKQGHAVLFVDLVQNPDGKMKALVGQGDTPACQFYLLNSDHGSPWISLDLTSDALSLPISKKMFWDGLRRFPTIDNTNQ
ncbi:MAG: hypothetical protein GF313_08025 [Caldithrix sp.]|nr:hypothetical protein [Caldithrix sp.]